MCVSLLFIENKTDKIIQKFIMVSIALFCVARSARIRSSGKMVEIKCDSAYLADAIVHRNWMIR